MKKALIPLLYIFVGTSLGTIVTRSCSKPKEIVTEIVKTDTLTIARVDTIMIEKPIPYKVVVRDTIYIRDTVGVTLLQEIKEFKDSTYYAKISGINAFLEEIRVYPKTVTKYVTSTITKKPNKWLLSVAAEYESLGEKNFVRAGGKIQYQDKSSRFSFEGGNEILSKKWYFKFKYERDILGW